MKKSLLMLNLLASGRGGQIKNEIYPVCMNCKFYRPEGKYGWNSKYGTCQKFGQKNVVTGIVKNDDAIDCRDNAEKCGIEGRLFEPEDFGDKVAKRVYFSKTNYFTQFIGLVVGTFGLTVLVSIIAESI